MSERLILLNDGIRHYVLPRSQQKYLEEGLLATHDGNITRHMFGVVEKGNVSKDQLVKEFIETFTQLENVLNNSKLAIVDSKLLRLIGTFEYLLDPNGVVIGPDKLLPSR